WDNGAGFLKYDRKNIKLNKWAHFLEKKGSCERANLSIKPQEWINESHQIALTHVYTLVPYQSPSKIYTMNAQSLVEQQVFYAGCRLASLLNRII
ncbi:MAG: S1/P1 nuclease, partial [bacterium]|nr:S1/P1 nuclease [bacterium]